MPSLASLSIGDRRNMLAAGIEVLECQRVLAKAGLNVVGQLLRGQGEFVEMNHYPTDDVYDPETKSQYYYHAHRDGDAEHGHFHTFVRNESNQTCHLVAISMDEWGYPIALFTTNRWVTDEHWVPASVSKVLLDQFDIDHAAPCWATNRWIGALLKLYRPFIGALLERRDLILESADLLEDRSLDVIGNLPIDVDDLIAGLGRSLQTDTL